MIKSMHGIWFGHSSTYLVVSLRVNNFFVVGGGGGGGGIFKKNIDANIT